MKRTGKKTTAGTAGRRSRGEWIFAAVVLVLLASGAYLMFGPWPFGGTNGRPTADPGDAALVALGGKVYGSHCAACHGAKLEGQKDWRTPAPGGGLRAPPHDATGHTWHHPDGDLFQITKFGGQKLAPAGFKSNMPGFGDRLSDKEIAAVLAFIKSRWPPRIREMQRRITESRK